MTILPNFGSGYVTSLVLILLSPRDTWLDFKHLLVDVCLKALILFLTFLELGWTGWCLKEIDGNCIRFKEVVDKTKLRKWCVMKGSINVLANLIKSNILLFESLSNTTLACQGAFLAQAWVGIWSIEVTKSKVNNIVVVVVYMLEGVNASNILEEYNLHQDNNLQW